MATENKNKSFRGMYFMLTEWPDALGRFAFFDNMTSVELRVAKEGLSDILTNTARRKFAEILPADSFVSLCMETGENGAPHFHYVVGVRNAISSNTIRKAFLFKDINGKKCKVLSMNGEEKETLIQIKKLQASIGRACQYLDKEKGEFLRSDGSDKRDTRETGVLYVLGTHGEWHSANKRGNNEGERNHKQISAIKFNTPADDEKKRRYKQAAEERFNERANRLIKKYYKDGVFDFENFNGAEAYYAGDRTFMRRFNKVLNGVHLQYMKENGLLVPVKNSNDVTTHNETPFIQ